MKTIRIALMAMLIAFSGLFMAFEMLSEAPRLNLSAISKNNYLLGIVSQPVAENIAETMIGRYTKGGGYYPRNYGLLPDFGSIVLCDFFKSAMRKEGKNLHYPEISSFDMSALERAIIYSGDTTYQDWEAGGWPTSKYDTKVYPYEKEIYSKMRKTGRDNLESDVVRKLYIDNKDFILYYIKEKLLLSERQMLVKDLEATLPFLDGSLDEALRDTLETYFVKFKLTQWSDEHLSVQIKLGENWGPKFWEKEEAPEEKERMLDVISNLSLKKIGRCEHFAVHTFSWVERRRMEHGDYAVEMYGKIIRDLISSIKKIDS